MGADAATKKCVTLIPGDGIGRECTRAVRRILEAAGAPLEWEACEAGAEVFRKGVGSGVPAETAESIARNHVALKGPLETPVGYGEKSANVTLRKMFELYANVRPARELPGVHGLFAGRGIDLVVVRENVEDLYAGVEHMQTPGVAQCLKIITRKGTEKILRLAFELARAEERRKVTCSTKSNIMKLTEGYMKRTFEEIAAEYPDIQTEHVIIDNCAHQLVRRPEQFDVIVTTNMNGDILSDLTSGLVGGLGLAPSANLGNEAAIFEAVHGSAPDIAGRDLANPTALLLSAVAMLRHLGLFDIAAKVEHAVVVTLEEGRALTGDLAPRGRGVSTTQFSDAVIANLGRTSPDWTVRRYRPIHMPQVPRRPDLVRPKSRRVLGVDLFLECSLLPNELGRDLEQRTAGSAARLKLISNRGLKVYPQPSDRADVVDCYRCRFVPAAGDAEFTDAMILDLLARVCGPHRWTHIEKLNEFDGQALFSKAQGED